MNVQHYVQALSKALKGKTATRVSLVSQSVYRAGVNLFFTETAQVTYHDTPIFTAYTIHGVVYIVLNTGGWRTVTTKRRMNECASALNLPFRVWQEKTVWYVSHMGEEGAVYDPERAIHRPFGKSERTVMAFYSRYLDYDAGYDDSNADLSGVEVSHGTLRAYDYAHAMAGFLMAYRPDLLFVESQKQDEYFARCGVRFYPDFSEASGIPVTLKLPNEDAELWDAEEGYSVIEWLSQLCEYACPPGHYYGAHEGDGSAFGFWPDPDSWYWTEEQRRAL